jgi:hypothetical protein
MSRVSIGLAGLCAGLLAILALDGPLGSLAAQQPDKKQPDKKTTTPDKKTPEKKPADKKEPEKKEPEKKAEAEAMPPDEPVEIATGLPSPLELVRGLREQGMSDLALEYLKDLEARANLPATDRAALPMERAKCQLEAADEEADETVRSGLIAEAKQGFEAFLKGNASHPRAAEASIALARLVSLEAKAQLLRARRAEDTETEKAEAQKARPLLEEAAKRFGDAAAAIAAQISKTTDPLAKRNLEREQLEAELARGINQFQLAETFVNADAAAKRERDGVLAKAKEIFETLGKGRLNTKAAWIGRAWMAECEMERGRPKDAEDEFDRVLKATTPAAEDGKRMARFFQIRRAFLEALGDKERSLPKFQAAEKSCRDWLRTPGYDSARKPSPEANSIRFYLALNLQTQARASMVPPKNNPSAIPPPGAAARKQLEEAERIYRALSQTDNEYTDRAVRRRMQVVRLMIGDIERPPSAYTAFDFCQMAALVQISKLNDLDGMLLKAEAEDAEVLRPPLIAAGGLGAAALFDRPGLRHQQQVKVVALLERARELATDKDSPADVTDVLIRLVYFYQVSGQPYHAAVLGEYIARRGGAKAALAGSLAVSGYASASREIKTTEEEKVSDARRADRERAIRLAKFLDEKHPADAATDRARHRLAGFLYEDGKLVEAYDALTRIRPGYEALTGARLLEGAVAYQLLVTPSNAKPPEGVKPESVILPDSRRVEVYRRAVGDLEKLSRPIATASVEEVRLYLSARTRVALLYLVQKRVDPEGEKGNPGYLHARKIAEEVLGMIPGFENLQEKGEGKKGLSLDGLEMRLLAEEVRTRAAFLHSRELFDAGNYDGAIAAAADVLAEMRDRGPYFNDEIKGWQTAETNDADAAHKGRVANLASQVDKYRRDLIVLAMRTRVQQGQAEKAGEALDQLKKFGGSLEATAPVLQQLSAEMAGQISSLRKAGKKAEADTLTTGFTKLVDKIAAEPKLPPGVQLFIGQSLVVVDQPAKAVEVLKKMPRPDAALLAQAADKLQPEQRQAVAIYRVGTLELVRAHRHAKQFNEADALLKEVIGTPEKPGWGYGSLDFRKEVAYLHEAKGADAKDPKAANTEWGLALKQWASLFQIAQNRLVKPPTVRRQTDEGEKEVVDEGRFLELKNVFFDAYFDHQRCLVRANMQLQKAVPDKLQRTMDQVAKNFIDLEKRSGPEINPKVRDRYAELLDEIPQLKKTYQAAGGKLFLHRDGAGA